MVYFQTFLVAWPSVIQATLHTIALTVSRDYRYLLLFSEISKKSNRKIFLLTPTIYFPKASHLFLIIPYFIRKIYDNLIEKKWIKLYSAISNNIVVIKPKYGYYESIKLFKHSFKIWRSLLIKEDLIKLEYNGIQIGHLIYDNYIRFINKPTVNLKSISLLFQIWKCISNIEFYSKYCFPPDQKQIHYYTPYSSYIANGSIAVGLLFNKDQRISVFTCSNPSYIKKISKEDQRHIPIFKNYHKEFKKLKNKEEKLQVASKRISERFKGNTDLSYMKVNVFSNNNIKLSEKYDGIMFLHDFMDAPHDYGEMIFSDFYIWTIHTFRFILENNLKIGVKFHPNQTKESKLIVDQLIKKFPKIKWINPKINNKEIFKSGIKFGFSVYGTILSELAYHDITPMALGENPYSAYNFVYNCKSKKEYYEFLINPKKIHIDKSQIFEFYYMNYIYRNSSIKYLDRELLVKLEKEEIDLKTIL